MFSSLLLSATLQVRPAAMAGHSDGDEFLFGRRSGPLLTMSTPPETRPSTSTGAVKSLYVGNLSFLVTEDALREIFSTLGQVAECKVIKDKATGVSAGYGFVRFEDHRSAELALASINGKQLHNQELRVNWAFQKEQTEDTSAHFHIFVGDLSPEINDFSLKSAFSEYPECSDARVLWDHITGRSKSYGFVSFRTREAAEDAIRRFDGQLIGHRRVRCDWAQHKQDPSANDYNRVDRSDPDNSNVYVGNLAPTATDQELRQLFQRFGEVVDVKLYRKGSYAFVHFARHEDAVNAIVSLNGQVQAGTQMAGGKPLKCSWGRHQARTSPMNLSMLSMFGPSVLQPQNPIMVPPQLQGIPPSHLLLQQQLAGLSLGGGQPQHLPALQQQQQQLHQQQQQSVQLLQQEQAAVAAAQMDPYSLYNLQAGMLPPSGVPGLYYPPAP